MSDNVSKQVSNEIEKRIRNLLLDSGAVDVLGDSVMKEKEYDVVHSFLEGRIMTSTLPEKSKLNIIFKDSQHILSEFFQKHVTLQVGDEFYRATYVQSSKKEKQRSNLEFFSRNY